MTRSTYIQAVFSHLKRLTKREREAIRRELDGHMEDHMEALRALGYDEALAEERTIAAMGDPEEVGRELNRQYPFRWLVVKWGAQGAAVLLMLFLLSGWWDVLDNLVCYARARLWPGTFANVEWLARETGQGEVDVIEKTEQRAELGTMTVRVWQVGLDQASERGGTAYVAFSCWDEEPWAEPPGYIEVYNDADGAGAVQSMGGSWGRAYAVPAAYGDTLRVCWYDELDHQYETLLTVELPWEESP